MAGKKNSGIIGWFLGIIDNFFLHWNLNKLFWYITETVRGEKDQYTLIQQSPILIKQSRALIEGWFILIEQSITLIEQSFTSMEQPPTPKTANPGCTFLKLGLHA